LNEEEGGDVSPVEDKWGLSERKKERKWTLDRKKSCL
jgi:hypothetical protein